VKSGKNYKVSSIGEIGKVGRVTLHDELGLTGSEVSVNNLPAGVSVPFVHAHKRNEEVYIVLKGKGQFYIDGDEFAVEEGDVLRLDPVAARCVKAGARVLAPTGYGFTEANIGEAVATRELMREGRSLAKANAVASMLHAGSRSFARPSPPLRKTWISRSLIFLRSVFRLTPSRSAARI